MSTALELGKKILLKRMLMLLEKEGYRVEFAPDYDGYIITDRREDPNIYLLTSETIENLRTKNAGNPGAFLNEILEHIKHNIGMSAPSIPPPSDYGTPVQELPENPPSPPPLYTNISDENQREFYKQTDSEDYSENDDIEEISSIIEEEGGMKKNIR